MYHGSAGKWTGLFPKLADKIIVGEIDGSIEEINVDRRSL